MAEQTSRLAVIIDSSGAQKSAETLASALNNLSQEGKKAETATDNLSSATKDLNSWLKQGPKAASDASKAIEDEAKSLNSLLEKIRPTNKALSQLDSMSKQLSQSFSKGLINESQFNTYDKILGNLVDKYEKVDDELTGIAQAEREAAAAAKATQQAHEAEALALQKMLDKLDPVSASVRRLEQDQQSLQSALSSGKISGDEYDNYAQKVDEARREVNGEAQAERDAAKAHDAQVASLQRLVAQLDPLGESFRKLSQQQQQLDDAKSSGMLSTDRYTELSAALTKTRDELQKTAEVSHTTAHAMQMLPMQMSYILSGLASGQSPFMVLMQQGGWLTGTFGGLGATIKGVGTYVAGLVNPFTVAAAAVGVLGLAYYEGVAEQEEFRKSLILTGNQVGKTSDQLSDMSTTISNVTGSTHGQAASVINQVVSAGNIAGDSLQKVSAAIVSISDATGQATDKLVSDFSNIANDPVAAITKLNDQYHFLTLATYNQIKALQDEGNQQDAARVANDAYANALTQRAGEIKNSLGTLETIWNSVGEAAKGAWDSMLDIGRGQTLQQQIANVQKQISDIQGNVKPGAFGLGGVGDDGVQNKQLAALKSQLLFLQSQATTQDVLNGFVDKHNQAQQAGIKAQEYIDNLQDQSLSNAEKRTKEQNLLTEALKKTRAAGMSISVAEEAQLRQDIDNKYKDPAAPKQHQGKAYTEDAGSRLVDQLNQQHASLVVQLADNQKIGTTQQALIKWEQQLADIKSKSTLTADQKSLLASQDKITALYQQNAALEKQEQLQKQASQLSGYQFNLNKDVSSRQSQYSTTEQAASGSISAYQQGILTQRVSLEQQLNEKIIQLRQQRTSATTAIDRDIIDKEISMQQAANDEMLKDYDTHTQKMESMRSSWSNGAEKAWAEYADSAENISGMTQTLFSDAFSGMEDSLVKFVTSGKLSFKSFADSVVSDQARIAARMAISGLANTAISGVSSLFSSGATAASASGAASSIGALGLSTSYTGYDSGGFTGVGGKYDPAGIVHKGEFVFTQEATNRIGKDNLARLMKGYSSGGYVGSPALSSVDGTSKSSSNSISLGGIVVNVNSQGQASSDSSTGGQSIARQIQAAVVNTINEQANKQGTPLWRAIKGR